MHDATTIVNTTSEYSPYRVICDAYSARRREIAMLHIQSRPPEERTLLMAHITQHSDDELFAATDQERQTALFTLRALSVAGAFDSSAAWATGAMVDVMVHT